MHHLTPEMQDCVDECLRCHSVCLGEAMNHCLEAGGKHVAPAHFRMMIACADTCRASADLMLIGSDLHRRTCGLCAEACDACGKSCEEVGDMERCVEARRRCAESCRRMAH